MFLFFLCSVSYAQSEKYKLLSSSQVYETAEIHLFVDGKEEPFYAEMIKDLSSVPLAELDDALITLLIDTKLYQNVNVEKFITPQGVNVFVANAFTIKRIQDIYINGLSFSERIDYMRILSTQRGQIYNESIANADAKKLEKQLNNRGYPNAKVDSVVANEISPEYVQLVFNVTKGNPCRIDQVVIEDYAANILNFLTVPIETGSICDVSSINETLELQKEKYWEQGYLQAKVKMKEINYSESKESAKITLQIDRGPKTSFQIFDQDSGLLDADFLISSQGLTYSDIMLMSDADLLMILNSFYQKQGYAFANVLGPERIVDKNGNTTLKFLLKKGSLVRIGKISFIGELPDSEQNIIKEIGLEKGLFSTGIPFVQDNLSLYRDKLRNIYLDKGFEDVQISIPDFVPNQNNTEMNLIFRIERGSKYVIKKSKLQEAQKDLILTQKNLLQSWALAIL